MIVVLGVLCAAAALPQSDDVSVAPIGHISLDEVGLFTEQQGGVGFEAYQGSDGALVETLLVTLPQAVQSDVARDLKNRLLASVTKAPKQYSNLFSFWEVKFKHLALGGQAEAINQMILQVPANMVSEKMHHIYVTSLFIGGKEEAACPLAKTFFEQYNGLLWRKMLIYCQAWQGKGDAAQFSISLLEEDGHQLPDEMKAILKKLADDEKQKMVVREEWSALLRKEVLALPPLNNPFPSLGYLYNSPVSGKELTRWWTDTKALSHNEKLEAVSRFYAVIEGLGTDVDHERWQEMLMFSAANELPLPDGAVAKLLSDAAQSQRKAETILVVLHVLGNHKAQELSSRKLAAMVDALHRTGFDKDARRLALEGIVD